MQQKMQWLEFSGTHLILLIRKKHCDSKGSGPWTQHCIEMVMNPAQYIPMHWHLHYNLQNNLVIKFNRSAQSCFSGSAWDRPVLSKGNIECSTHSGNYLWEGEGALDLLRLPHFLPDPSYTIPMGGKLVQPSHDYSFQATINIHDWITRRKMGGWDKECLRVANCSRFRENNP